MLASGVSLKREGVAPQGQPAEVPAALPLDASLQPSEPRNARAGDDGVWWRTGGGAGHQYDMFVRIPGDGSVPFSIVQLPSIVASRSATDGIA